MINQEITHIKKKNKMLDKKSDQFEKTLFLKDTSRGAPSQRDNLIAIPTTKHLIDSEINIETK